MLQITSQNEYSRTDHNIQYDQGVGGLQWGILMAKQIDGERGSYLIGT